ncbi:hypothetical protein SLE2022_027470 [Rubroshorea leprosula]
METGLNNDVLEKIVRHLDDPSDIVRVSCVSREWRYFVIANGFAKHLCLRMFPQLSRVDHVVEPASMAKSLVAVGPSNMERETWKKEHKPCAFFARGFPERQMVVAVGPSNMEWETLKKRCRACGFWARGFMSFPEKQMDVAVGTSNLEWETLKKEHRAYAFLARGFMSFPEKRMVKVRYRASYENPVFPIILTYKLVDDICVVTEIRKKIFRGPPHFQSQWGMDSAKSIQFRMGHLNSFNDDNPLHKLSPDSLGDKFVWTYTSPEFPVVQEDLSQSFKLPEPVLCIGGRLQIVLRGDGSFNFIGRTPHFKVFGRPLSPAFKAEMLGPSGNFVLKALSYTQPWTVAQETRNKQRYLA